MIADKIAYWNRYPYGLAWQTAFEFLKSLPQNAVEKKYEIQNDDMYAIVATYNTKTPHKFEAHREYVDIQCLFEGQEIIESTAIDELTLDTPYDPEKDIEFYRPTDKGKTITRLIPGFFVVYFPHDAHMPCLSVADSPEFVKKVVIKIKWKLLPFGN